MTEFGLGELGDYGLCGSKIADGDEELVVYCATIIQEGAVDNKLLVALSDLAPTQAAATELTKTNLSQLFDYSPPTPTTASSTDPAP